MENRFFLIIPAATILAISFSLMTFTISTYAQSETTNQTMQDMGQSANQTGEHMQKSANQTGEAIQGNASQIGSKITEGAKNIVGSIGKELEKLGK